jgi:hypothetical protein
MHRTTERSCCTHLLTYGFRHIDLLTHNLIYVSNINLAANRRLLDTADLKCRSHGSWGTQTLSYTPIACLILVESINVSSVSLRDH